MELSLIEARSNAAKKVVDGLDDFRTYICNNREFIPNFVERRRQGETISTGFVESTINQVVSRRFVKKEQMNGRCAGPIFCCRPGRGSSTRIWTTYFAVGIQNSGRNHKRRSQSARRLDPRLFGALPAPRPVLSFKPLPPEAEPFKFARKPLYSLPTIIKPPQLNGPTKMLPTALNPLGNQVIQRTSLGI